MTKFDLEQELNELPVPRMFLAGLKHYIKSHNKTIKSKKELDKVVKEYGELEI